MEKHEPADVAGVISAFLCASAVISYLLVKEREAASVAAFVFALWIVPPGRGLSAEKCDNEAFDAVGGLGRVRWGFERAWLAGSCKNGERELTFFMGRYFGIPSGAAGDYDCSAS